MDLEVPTLVLSPGFTEEIMATDGELVRARFHAGWNEAAEEGTPSSLSPAEKYDMAFNGWTPEASFFELRPFTRSEPTPEEDWDPAYYDGLG